MNAAKLLCTQMEQKLKPLDGGLNQQLVVIQNTPAKQKALLD